MTPPRPEPFPGTVISAFAEPGANDKSDFVLLMTLDDKRFVPVVITANAAEQLFHSLRERFERA